MLINWTNGTNNNRRVVYINTTNNFIAPVNGTDPSTNPNYLLGSGQQCVYNDNGIGVLITGLSCSTQYFFRIYEVNCTGPNSIYNISSALNNPNSQQTTSCACITPGTPTNVSALSTGLNTANLSWTAGTPEGSPLPTYYWVVGTTSSVTYGNGIAQGNTTEKSAIVTTLLPNTTYYLRVYASVNCNGSRSSYGNSISFTTQVSNNVLISDNGCINGCTPSADGIIISVTTCPGSSRPEYKVFMT